MSSLPPRPRLPGRPSTAEHQAAITRRLDLLRAELAAPPGSQGSLGSSGGHTHRVVGRSGPVGRAGSAGPAGRAGGRAVIDEVHDVGIHDDVDGDGHLDGDVEAWWGDATRPSASGPPVASPPPVLPAPVPVPGRHASRRAVTSPLADPALAGWRERLTLGPAQLSVVAVVVALGLAVTAWGVVRARPQPLPVASTAAAPTTDAEIAVTDDLVALDPSSTPSGAASPPGSPVPVDADAVAGADPAPQSVTVDVAGKVRRPGIAVLAVGARVVDAIEAAGGARAGVDLTSLNLARPLVDGEQVLVGIEAAPGADSSATLSGTPAPAGDATGSRTPLGAPGAAGPLVDLNSATESQLDSLPEVGPVTAAAIVAWRTEHGGFSSVDELLEVDGIGDATLATIAPLVTV